MSKRRNVSSTTIYNAIRHNITSGALKPGEALKPQVLLAEEFQASPMTIQRAIDRLASEEFVFSIPRKGVFVHDRPPSLHRYMILISDDPRLVPNLSLFERTVIAAADAENAAKQREIELIFAGQVNRDSFDGFRRAAHLFESHLVRGAVFGFYPSQFIGTPLLNQRDGVPRVIMTTGGQFGDIRCIGPNSDDIMREGLHALAAQGIRTVGLIGLNGITSQTHTMITQMVSDAGLQTERRWIQATSHTGNESAHLMELMMYQPRGQRPDGILILDDNLLAPCMQGLEQTNIVVGKDVEIAAHANVPLVQPSPPGVIRIGYDVRAWLSCALDWIDAEASGTTPAPSPRALLPQRIPTHM